MPSFDKDLAYLKPGEVDNLSLGQNGYYLETGTTAVTENIFCFLFLSDTVFTSLTGENLEGDAITTATFPQGFYLFGRFSAFQLTSGAVVAYKYAD